MAYIDELRKYTDQPQYGQGGFNLGGIISAIQNLFKPAPKPAAPAPKSTPKPAPKPTPSYSAPRSSPAPMSSQSGAPRSYQGQSQGSIANAYVPNASSNQMMSPARIAPAATPKIAQKPAQIVQPKQNNAMADLRNAGSGVVNLLGSIAGQNKGMVPFNYNYTNDLRKLAGGLVGTAGTIATQFMPKVYAADYNPFEFGLSERIAGTSGQPKVFQPGSGAAGETSGQVLGKGTKAPTVGPLKTGFVGTPGYSQGDVANKDAFKAQNDYSQGVDKANQESNDLYAILSDPAYQAQVDQANEAIYQEYVNGNISYEDYLNRANEEQKRIVEAQYARAKAEAESQIPGIESEINNLVENAQTGLNRYTAAADQEAARQAAIYDENLKRSVKNQKMSEGNLRNTFSNLGTAESSAFIDKLMELTKEAGAEQAGIDTSKATALGDISKQKLYEGQDTEKYIKTTREKGASDIANIRKYIQNLSGQQIDAISNLMSQLYQNLAAGQQNLANQKGALAERKAQQAYNLQNIMQNYAVGNQQTKDYFNAMQGVTGVNGSPTIGGKYVRPAGFSSDLWNAADKLYQGGLRGMNLVNQLKRAGITDAQDWMYNYLLNPN